MNTTCEATQASAKPLFTEADNVLRKAMIHALRVGQANPKLEDVDMISFSSDLEKAIEECTKCASRERQWMRTKTVYVGRDGWPVAGIIGHPFITFLRRLIHTKKKMSYGEWLAQGGCKIDFE